MVRCLEDLKFRSLAKHPNIQPVSAKRSGDGTSKLLIIIFISLTFSKIVPIHYYGVLTTDNLKYLFPDKYNFYEEDISVVKRLGETSDNFIYHPSNKQNKQFSFIKLNKNENTPFSALLYCNKPESVRIPMLLYSVEVAGDSRLIFFHKNVSGKDGYLSVDLRSHSGIRYQGGIGGPINDEIFAGRIIAERYYRNGGNGFLARGRWTKSFFMKDNSVFGGMIDLFPIDEKERYQVKVYFHHNKKRFRRLKGHFSRALYPYRRQVEDIHLKSVGKRYNLVIARDQFLTDQSQILHGNYGVDYQFKLYFDHPGIYEVLFTPNGGPAGIVYMIGDKLFSTYSNKDKKIGEIVIEKPQVLNLYTFPLSGSNYPTTLTIVKSVDS